MNKEQLLSTFTSEVDATINQYRTDTVMPTSDGTVSWMRDCYAKGLEVMKVLDADVTALANRYIVEHSDNYPGISQELLTIAQPRMRDFIVEILPGKKG